MVNKRKRRKSNKAMLIDRLFKGYVQRTDADFGDKPKTVAQKLKAAETSHMQGMAALFARELEELSKGSRECMTHDDRVEGACPICEGIWEEPQPLHTYGRKRNECEKVYETRVDCLPARVAPATES